MDSSKATYSANNYYYVEIDEDSMLAWSHIMAMVGMCFLTSVL